MLPTVVVVNLVGGYIPYIGASVGGGLTVLLALAEGSFVKAVTVLVLVFSANLLLENLLEPKIMSGRLRIHPLAVLLATTAGGVLGGIVGLVLAVPLTVVSLASVAG
jgi:putative heme transporter